MSNYFEITKDNTPPPTGDLRLIEILKIEFCTKIPDYIKSFINLKKLVITNNDDLYDKKIPDFIYDFIQLQELYITDNYRKYFKNNIQDLDSISYDKEYHRIFITEDIGKLQNLVILDISSSSSVHATVMRNTSFFHPPRTLPKSILTLKKLKVLNISKDLSEYTDNYSSLSNRLSLVNRLPYIDKTVTGWNPLILFNKNRFVNVNPNNLEIFKNRDPRCETLFRIKEETNVDRIKQFKDIVEQLNGYIHSRELNAQKLVNELSTSSGGKKSKIKRNRRNKSKKKYNM